MLKTLIIDDEQNAAKQLADLLTKHCSKTLKVAGCFHTVEDGVKAIRTLLPDLVFLDVHIYDKTCFDLLQQLPEKNFDIIFATAYDKYAVQAFKFSAIDYLLKPIHPDDLKKAVEKIQLKKKAGELAKLETLLENVEQLKQYTTPKKIIVPTVNGFELLPVIDILRCQSEINYTTIFLRDKQKLVVAKTLKEFEDMLGEYNFFRIHNSHLVNLSYVKSYQKGKGGSVVLTDGTEIEVSTRRKDDFLERMSRM
ncbi:MAG: LytTR family DNA-binding domain-containing protein [Niabella sp.]